jgi:hypothetical protein
VYSFMDSGVLILFMRVTVRTGQDQYQGERVFCSKIVFFTTNT